MHIIKIIMIAVAQKPIDVLQGFAPSTAITFSFHAYYIVKSVFSATCSGAVADNCTLYVYRHTIHSDMHSILGVNSHVFKFGYISDCVTTSAKLSHRSFS